MKVVFAKTTNRFEDYRKADTCIFDIPTRPETQGKDIDAFRQSIPGAENWIIVDLIEGNKKYELICISCLVRRPFSEFEEANHIWPKHCERTMKLRKAKTYPVTQCTAGSCVMALEAICRCECEGKFHASERWRNHYLVGSLDEYKLCRPLKVQYIP